MTGILVDQDLCTRCRICSNVCPLSVIDTADEKSLPRVREDRSDNCIGCGHCEVFCPSGALMLDHSPDESRPVRPAEISPEVLGPYLKARRSVRHFRPEPVDREEIVQILDVTRYAASAGDGHPVKWLVVRDGQEVRRIAGMTVDWLREVAKSSHPMGVYAGRLVKFWDEGIDRVCWNAPHLLFAHIPDNNPAAIADAFIALTYIDISAPAYGVGTCWAGFVANAAMTWKPLQEALALPEGRKVAYAMMFGYPRYKIYKIPHRDPVEITWR